MSRRTINHATECTSVFGSAISARKAPIFRGYSAAGAESAATVAERLIAQITEAVAQGETKRVFDAFLDELQSSIDSSITAERAIEMLSQHAITAPVFNALFKDYAFANENAVSVAMNNVLSELRKAGGLADETDELRVFYEKVRRSAVDVDNPEARQQIIIELYNTFFKAAFPKMAEMLGIVYTPIEIVDFILHSVNDVLHEEFGRRLTDENVKILDPFTGTGTFITRLIQSGLIEPKDLPRKYSSEIYAYELVLLAYYIACVNIENCYHHAVECEGYVPFPGIVWTDTFQTAEDYKGVKTLLEENSERVLRQSAAPIQVIIGNPPYSAGQKSANDNAQNRRYPHLDHAIKHSYAALSTAVLKRSLYDSYIRAFRYASDRLRGGDGIICFVSNGGWLDGNASAGFRKSLEREFSKIYVLNLRGNARMGGKLADPEGEPVFAASSLGGGTRVSICITLLVMRSTYVGEADILYSDIGDNLSRNAKLSLLRHNMSFRNPSLPVVRIVPNEYGDWIGTRNEAFRAFLPIAADRKSDESNQAVFVTHSRGLATSRDAWVYSYSKVDLERNVRNSIAFYNDIVAAYRTNKLQPHHRSAAEFIAYDSTKFSWDRHNKADVENGKSYSFSEHSVILATYRPFQKQWCYFNRHMNNCAYQLPKYFPSPRTTNLLICTTSIRDTKEFSCLITANLADLHFVGTVQAFPLYYYDTDNALSRPRTQQEMFEPSKSGWNCVRHDGISESILAQARQNYGPSIFKEDIFYYVYGILHSPEYRESFATDLNKSLPRIPLVEFPDDFWTFSKAGRALAHLHLNYETIAPLPQVTIKGVTPYELENARNTALAAANSGVDVAAPGSFFGSPDTSARLRVTKMRFLSKTRKDTIIFNPSITIQNIPDKAYEYVVNGKSGIEWIMDRYQVKTDKDSGITNDPNLYGEELGQPYYILNLLLSVIAVSVRTQEIVEGLPGVSST